MEKFWLISIPIFILFTFLLWKISIKYYKQENSEKMWKLWGLRTAYWEGVILISGFLTFLVLIILKWTDLMPI